MTDSDPEPGGSSSTLEVLLAPVSPGQFISDYWGRLPLWLNDRCTRHRDLFGARWGEQGTTSRLLEDLATGSKRTGAVAGIFGRNAEIHRIDTDISRIDTLLKMGAAVVLDEASGLDAKFGAFVSSIKRELNYLGEVDSALWISPPGVGVPCHFDRSPALQVQLQGKKRWTISKRPAVEWPRANTMRRADGTAVIDIDGWQSTEIRVDDAEFQVLVTSPGDVIYLPGGTWHQTEAVEGAVSLALGLTFKGMSFRHVVASLLEETFEASSAWRQMIPATRGDPWSEVPPLEVQQFFADRLGELRALMNSLGPADPRLHATWQKLVSQSTSKGAQVRRASRATLEPNDVLSINMEHPLTHVVGRTDAGGPMLRIFHGESEACFDDPDSFAFGRTLLEQSRFVASASTGWSSTSQYAWDDVKPILEALIAKGILCRH